MAVYHDARCRLCRREGHEAVPQGHALLHRQVRDRAARLRSRRARQEPARRRRRTTASSCARSRRRGASTACSSASSATSSPRRRMAKGVTGEVLLQMLERRLDNVVYRLGFALVAQRGAPARAPRPLHGERPQGRHPVVPGARRATRSSRAREEPQAHRRRSTRSRPARARACRSGSSSTPTRLERTGAQHPDARSRFRCRSTSS